MRKTLLVLTCIGMMATTAMAGGYQVRLQGARQTGMGLIGTPMAFGSSSIFYNPGAMGFHDSRFDFTIGGSTILSRISYQAIGSDYTAKTDNPVSTPFFFYAQAKITEKLVAGVGVYTPYGSKSVWPDDWKGRYLIQNIGLQAIYIQPTISYKLTDWLGIGAGLVLVNGKVDLEKGVPYNEGSKATLSGTANSMGFNVGVFIKPCEKLAIGIDYRSHIDTEVEGGDAAFSVPASLNTLIPASNKFNASLPLPANLDFGVSYKVNEKWTVAFELDYVFWGKYDTLNFTFEEAGDKLNSVNPRLYSNRLIPRIGAEYTLNEKLQFRFGAYYDQTPTNQDYFNPETVSLNTLALSAGVTYKPLPNLRIDVSYLQLHGMESERSYLPANFSGKYRSFTAIPGLGITYSF